MKKLITITGAILLLSAVLSMSGCGWGAWHGHGAGHRFSSNDGAGQGSWLGPVNGYNYHNANRQYSEYGGR